MNASTKIALKIARGEWHPKGHDFCGVCVENKPVQEPEKFEPVSIECECVEDAACEQPEPECIEPERIEQEPVKPAQMQAKQSKKARKRR